MCFIRIDDNLFNPDQILAIKECDGGAVIITSDSPEIKVETSVQHFISAIQPQYNIQFIKFCAGTNEPAVYVSIRNISTVCFDGKQSVVNVGSHQFKTMESVSQLLTRIEEVEHWAKGTTVE